MKTNLAASDGGAPGDVFLWRALASMRAVANERVDRILRLFADGNTKTSNMVAHATRGDLTTVQHDLENLCDVGLLRRWEEIPPGGGLVYFYRLNADGWNRLAAVAAAVAKKAAITSDDVLGMCAA